jgi:hypothetical protein
MLGDLISSPSFGSIGLKSCSFGEHTGIKSPFLFAKIITQISFWRP